MEVQFPVQKYGYASFSIDKDQSYSFTITILHNVIFDKNILGNTYNKIIINAGYKNFKTGKYAATDSTIIFLNYDGTHAGTEKYSFNGRTLFTQYKDREKNTWLISWEKDSD